MSRAATVPDETSRRACLAYIRHERRAGLAVVPARGFCVVDRWLVLTSADGEALAFFLLLRGSAAVRWVPRSRWPDVTPVRADIQDMTKFLDNKLNALMRDIDNMGAA